MLPQLPLAERDREIHYVRSADSAGLLRIFDDIYDEGECKSQTIVCSMQGLTGPLQTMRVALKGV